VAFILVFIIALTAIIGWWLSTQRLTSKPWLETGVAGEVADTGASHWPTAKIGLVVFLAVVTSLFALFFSAYSMRASLGDWRPLPVPRLLWLNTGILAFSSIALEYARSAARRGAQADLQAGLLAGGVSAMAFIAGQLLAWQQLNEAGYFLATNPANTFFYLLTAVHAVHLIGGLVALGRAAVRVRGRAVAGDDMQLSIDLCAIYWHFLLLVWLVMFALLLTETNTTLAEFILRCKSLIFGSS
jgi:cytochrome c oxidase subunit 3